MAYVSHFSDIRLDGEAKTVKQQLAELKTGGSGGGDLTALVERIEALENPVSIPALVNEEIESLTADLESYEFLKQKRVETHELFDPEDVSIAINALLEEAESGDYILLGPGKWKTKKIKWYTKAEITLAIRGDLELIEDRIMFEVFNGWDYSHHIHLNNVTTSVNNAAVFALRTSGGSEYKLKTASGFAYGIALIPNCLFWGVKGSISSGSDTLTVNNPIDLKAGQYITIDNVSGVKKISEVNGTTVTLDSTADESVTDACVRGAFHIAKATLTKDSADIVVDDTTYLSEGQSISIKGINGTKTISNISGNTVTLDSAVDIEGADVFVSSLTATLTAGSDIIELNDTSNVFVGMHLVIQGYKDSRWDNRIIEIIDGTKVRLQEPVSKSYTNEGVYPQYQATQYSKFYWDVIDAKEACIYLESGGWDSWINDNRFYGGRLKGKHGLMCTAGVGTVYGNNKFYDIGFEGLTGDAIHLEKVRSSLFMACRCAESIGGWYIDDEPSCYENYFFFTRPIDSRYVRLLGRNSKLVSGTAWTAYDNITTSKRRYITKFRKGYFHFRGTTTAEGTSAYLLFADDYLPNLEVGMTLALEDNQQVAIDSVDSGDKRITMNPASTNAVTNQYIAAVLTGVTGTISKGSTTLTLAGSTDIKHLVAGLYLTVEGLPGYRRITGLDLANNKVTLATPAESKITSGAVDCYAPYIDKQSKFMFDDAQRFTKGDRTIELSEGYSVSVGDLIEISGAEGLYEITVKAGSYPATITLDSPLKNLEELMPWDSSFKYTMESVKITADQLLKAGEGNVRVDASSNAIVLYMSRYAFENKIVYVTVKDNTNPVYLQDFRRVPIIYSANKVATGGVGTYMLRFSDGKWAVMKISDDKLLA